MNNLSLFFHENLITDTEIRIFLQKGLESLHINTNTYKKITLIPPDGTRHHSRGGFITCTLYELLQKSIHSVIPALGTHAPLSTDEINELFAHMPHTLFTTHAWRDDTVTLGCVEAEKVKKMFAFSAEQNKMLEKSGFDCSWPIQVNKHIVKHSQDAPDLLISIGQVVPHEIAGMANHAKNIFVGLGGKDAIDKSHFLAAVYGLERIIGNTENPVRQLFDTAGDYAQPFLPPVLYIQTVISTDKNGKTGVSGIFMSFGRTAFEQAARHSCVQNITHLKKPLKKIVAWMDPHYMRSTWIANKAIYRLRKAIAAGGELIIIAPAVDNFGEDPVIDQTIRRYGYRSAQDVLHIMASQAESTGLDASEKLINDLCGAAHLIHGCSGGRFSITYCPGTLSQSDIEGVGFKWMKSEEALERYITAPMDTHMHTGMYKTSDGEEYYFVENPALGLWQAD